MTGGYGYYDGDIYDGNGDLTDPSVPGTQQGRQQPNPLRDHLKKVEDQNTELQKQLSSLLKKQRENEVADALQAKGYERAAAGLYAGEPEKLDEWLTSFGPLLNKATADPSAQGAPQQQGQGPASTVPADGQAAMQQLQGMGTNAAAPQGTEAEQIAQMRQMQDPAKLMEYLQSQGNPYFFNG